MPPRMPAAVIDQETRTWVTDALPCYRHTEHTHRQDQNQQTQQQKQLPRCRYRDRSKHIPRILRRHSSRRLLSNTQTRTAHTPSPIYNPGANPIRPIASTLSRLASTHKHPTRAPRWKLGRLTPDTPGLGCCPWGTYTITAAPPFLFSYYHRYHSHPKWKTGEIRDN